MKRKLLFSALFSIICLSLAFGKSVGYNYKGEPIKFSIIKSDSIDYLVLTIESSDLVIDPTPEMKLRFFNGDTMTLTGDNGGSKTRHTTVPGAYGTVITTSSNISVAKFPVTKEQIEKFSLGVKKIRISTLPKIHEKEFKKDKFGNKLYKLYLKTEKAEDF